MKKKFITTFILSALLASGAYGAEFQKVNTYDNTFTDVPATEWYASEVASTYELGLMNGVGAGLFNPSGNVTRAEAITMAARVAATYNGETIPSAEGEWYTQYVNYAVAKGFLAEGRFAELDVPATRAEVAELFANALPADAYTVKNAVESIPDVGEHLANHADMLRLYKAGIVMGSDSYGNFRPEDNIIRAEAAAILNRVALPEKRLSKTLDKISEDDAYILIINNSMTGGYDGISSGWVLDNRGGVPKNELKSGYGALTDIRDDMGTAYIRGINKTSMGVLTFQTSVQVNGDGGYMEMRNEADKSVYRVESKDGKWQLLGADGTYTALCDITDFEKPYEFRMIIDLDNNRSTTFIDNVLCGTYPLITSGADSNILNFRYATTEEAKVTLAPGGMFATANYGVYDYFDVFTADGVMPFGWYGNNAVIHKNELALSKGGIATKTFTPISGKVVAECWYLSSEVPASYTVLSGAKKIAEFTNDADNFYVNGNTVYEDYVDGIWYRLRFELDTETGLMDVKLNGRYVAKDLAFGEKTTSIDTITVANSGDGEVRFDNFKVSREIKHDDYVPVPVPVVDDYNIGINVCSLWQNGTHGGWSCITPYDDKQPILGYYDEGNPETADWEIKYFLEHGVDFQAFCFFFNQDWPQRPVNEVHLFDGYMNAKYSDMSKYCIIWEAGNSQSPRSMAEWKNNYVPYIVENFLKDPRYMTIENRPVLAMFGMNDFRNRAGSNAAVKEMFDYLEEVAKGLGFDGMLYIGTSETTKDVYEMGFDAAYIYSWSRDGYKLSVNKEGNLRNINRKLGYFVPTVSVGFNDIGWNTERYPLITGEDYKLANEWVRDTYLKTYPTEKWQEKFVMLSTWNEYGEGTYVMPTTDDKGFAYLDAIREVYGGIPADEKLNTVPSEEQLYRITHLYPQYHRLLRKQGYYNSAVREDEIEVLTSVDYATEKPENVIVHFMDYKQTSDGIVGKSTGNDPKVMIDKFSEMIPTKSIAAIRFTVDLPAESVMEIFYSTTDNPGWKQGNGKSIGIEKSGMQEITILTRDLNNFTGDLVGIRIDPCTQENVNIKIKKIEILGYTTTELQKKIVVNGNEDSLYFAPKIADNGDILTAFDAERGLDFKLALYDTWDSENQTLTLMSKDHTAVFTVGKNTYTVDGAVKTLDYELALQDGLPLLPINRLCEDFGYKFEVKEEVIYIETFELEYYDEVRASMVEGVWNFNFNGNSEEWTSADMTLTVADGYMRCTNSSGSGDPKIGFGGATGFDVKKYKAFEFKIRYDYVSDAPSGFMIYFTTDTHPGLSESQKVYHKLNGTSSDGEWETYTVDLTSLGTWDGKMATMRLDVFDATSGTMDIDYMKFIPNPDYVPPADSEDATLTEEDVQKWVDENSYTWLFDTDDFDEGWKTSHLNVTVDDGIYKAKSNSEHVDPNILFNEESAIIDAKKYSALEIKVRYKYNSDEKSFMQMFYTTDQDPKVSESKSFVMHLKSTDTKGEWETYTVNLTDKPLWNGQIMSFRLDPFNSYGEFEIDYIKLVANSELMNTGVESGPRESTFSGIFNGDAEAMGGFKGDNQGIFETVSAPDRPGTYCFRNLPKSENQMWLYCMQKVTFTAGAKYAVKVDIRLASHGTDENVGADLAASVCCNVQYDGKDHVVASLPITVGDGWKTFEFEFTVDGSSKSREFDNFCFYSNPVGGKGIGYYLDNISVVEIG